MRILITGGCGFIGSHLLKACIAAEHHVETMDSLTYAGCKDNLPWRYQGLRVADVCDRTMVDAILTSTRPDWVIHAAAETHVGRAIAAADPFLQTNVMGTHTMLEASLAYWRAREHDAGFRFLHVSTDEVYGSIERGEWTKDSPYQPNNQYAASKAAADHLCRALWATQRLPVIVTHCGNNYGIRQHPEKLIPTLIRQSLAGEAHTLHGDGLHIRDWIAVEDHCEGILAALARGHPGMSYAFSAGETLSNLRVAELVHDAVHDGDPTAAHLVDHIADRAGNDRRYAMDCHATRAMLGWSAQRQMGPAMDGMVAWYRDNQSLPYGQGAKRAWG